MVGEVEADMSAHGGKRKGAGRPRNDPPTKSHNVCITDEQARLLRMWGRGDLSAGLRWLIEAAAPMVGRPVEELPARPRSSG